jgi:hypothetical protein
MNSVIINNSSVVIQVPTPVVMKSSFLWNITPCSPLQVNWCFGGIFRLHLQGRTSHARNQREASSKLLLLVSVVQELYIIYQAKLDLDFLLYNQGTVSYGNTKLRAFLFSALLVTCLHARFLLYLFFGPEDGSEMFIRNNSWFSTDCAALYPKNSTLRNHRCENLFLNEFHLSHNF